MPRDRIVRRVRWKVTRAANGWKPIVTIGEEPISLAVVSNHAEARKNARAMAQHLREAGQ